VNRLFIIAMRRVPLFRILPARHPPCVDGSPVWPPDRDVYSTLQHATELVLVVASSGSATCPAARFASTWPSQRGKRSDGTGAVNWLSNLASTWTSQCGKRSDGTGAVDWLPNLASTWASQRGKPTPPDLRRSTGAAIPDESLPVVSICRRGWREGRRPGVKGELLLSRSKAGARDK
jgi:hypothetical protein